MQITQNEPTAAERRIPFLAVQASANSLQLVDLADIATAEVATPAAPTVTPQGTAGTTAYSYKVVARNANGETLPSTAGSTATGNATLGVTNFNRITWAAVTGAASYDVYRSASAGTPATTGKIVSATAALTADDTGLAASGAEPSTNTTADRFTLTVTTTTAEVKYAADMSSAIETALEALAEVAAGDVQAFKLSSGQVYAVGFSGTLAGTSVPLMVIGGAVGFTPGAVTGGLSDSAVTGIGGDWPAADIRITKAAAAAAQGAGTVAEDEDGVYNYIATAGEVDTLGPLVGKVRTFGVSVYPFSAQVIDASSAGETVLRTGTAQAGAAGSITLDTGASGTSDFYVPSLVYIESGTGAGQGAVYGYAYNGTTKILSVEPGFVTPPDNTSVFKLVLTPPVAWDFTQGNHAEIGTFGDISTPVDVADQVLGTITTDNTAFPGADVAAIRADTEDIQSRIPAALVSGRMSSDAVAISGSTATADKLEAHTAAVLQVVIGAGSGTTSVVLNATTGIDGGAPSATNDAYNGRVLVLTSGALAGQAQAISDYVGGTVTLTTGAFTGAPAEGVTGVIV